MKLRYVVLIALSLTSMETMAVVAPGELDPAFGTGGKQTVAIDVQVASAQVNIAATVVGPQQWLYLVGAARQQSIDAIGIARIDADGMIDEGFGNGGVIVHALETGGVVVRDAAVDPQGRLIVVGAGPANLLQGYLVCRFGVDGDPDATFGDGPTPGCTVIPAPGGSATGTAESVVVQPCSMPEDCIDGQRIVLAGGMGFGAQRRGIVLALKSDGSELDQNFGSGGFSVPEIPGEPHPSLFTALALGSGGELVAAGYFEWSTTDRDFLVYKITQQGLPADFGEEGTQRSLFDLGGFFANIDEAYAVRVLDDGAVLLAGTAQTGPVTYRAALVKYDSAGTLDPNFAGEGAIVKAPGKLSYAMCGDTCDMGAHAIDVLPDESIVVVGSIADGVPGDSPPTLAPKRDMFALRLHPDGGPDARFHSPDSAFDGLATIGFDLLGDASEDAAFGLVVQGDRLLVSGIAAAPDGNGDGFDDYHFAIARLGNGTPLFADGFED